MAGGGGGGGVWRHEIKLNWLPGFLEKKKNPTTFHNFVFELLNKDHVHSPVMWEIPFGLHLHECSRPYSQRCSV